ncbi:MAG: Maf family protein [Candidatus Sulfotelmatobacter sp.]
MLILASASPRRHELLRAAGIDHVVRPSYIPETREPGETAENFVRRLSKEKVDACDQSGADTVLGADTVVCLEGEVLGKPADPGDAVRMLQQLAGREHRVLTGIHLKTHDRAVSDLAETRVWFSPMTREEIQEYVSTGEPMDKAGAYAIQGFASRFVYRIEGCYQNVVGLPVSLVYKYLNTL